MRMKMQTKIPTLRDAAAWTTQARIIGNPDTPFTSVSIDSRTLAPQALFVALPGERVDGHTFLAQAAARSASAALISCDYTWDAKAPSGPSLPLPALQVPDTQRALEELARHWRAAFSLPLVAVTGSNGKTTVKEMIAAIFAAAVGIEHRLATQGNLNNAIGVPLSLLRLQDTDRLAVIELGMNHPGETEHLAQLAQPTIALINNAQREHQEFMSSVEAVALEHASILHALAPDGIAVFPADDPYTPLWREAAGQRPILDFALHTARDADTPISLAAIQGTLEATQYASQAQTEGQIDSVTSTQRLHIRTPAGAITVTLQALGVHNQRNALAASATALAAGVDLSAIRQGLESFVPVSGRLALQHIAEGPLSGIRVIDDSYNANPDSMRAAIDVLTAYPSPRILVIGDMGEVGTQSQDFHQEIGVYARACGIDKLYTLGKDSYYTCEAFGAGAMHFDAIEPLIQHMQSIPFDPQATLLIKGSRFMKMERIIQQLSHTKPS